MTRRMLTCACALSAAWAGTADPAGMRPRPELSDYPAHRTAAGVTIAADALSAGEARRQFATDLSAGWIVVEVAVYPGSEAVNVQPSDFVLRVERGGRRTIVRPATPQAIAAGLQRQAAPEVQPPVTVYPTAGVGYESGPGPYRGPRTSAGVGVAIGQPAPPGPASTPADRDTMEVELSEKSLPAGSVAKPVAGYLYFPRPSGKGKTGSLELHYYQGESTLQVALPDPKNR